VKEKGKIGKKGQNRGVRMDGVKRRREGKEGKGWKEFTTFPCM